MQMLGVTVAIVATANGLFRLGWVGVVIVVVLLGARLAIWSRRSR